MRLAEILGNISVKKEALHKYTKYYAVQQVVPKQWVNVPPCSASTGPRPHNSSTRAGTPLMNNLGGREGNKFSRPQSQQATSGLLAPKGRR